MTDNDITRPTGPDPVTLVAGSLCLIIAAGVIFGISLHWLLPGAAIAIGTVLLVAAQRRRPQ